MCTTQHKGVTESWKSDDVQNCCINANCAHSLELVDWLTGPDPSSFLPFGLACGVGGLGLHQLTPHCWQV